MTDPDHEPNLDNPRLVDRRRRDVQVGHDRRVRPYRRDVDGVMTFLRKQRHGALRISDIAAVYNLEMSATREWVTTSGDWGGEGRGWYRTEGDQVRVHAWVMRLHLVRHGYMDENERRALDPDHTEADLR